MCGKGFSTFSLECQLLTVPDQHDIMVSAYKARSKALYVYRQTGMDHKLMQTIADNEIKHRGLAALESLLEKGPVRVLKDDQSSCVVLSEADYSRLRAQSRKASGGQPGIWDVILSPSDPKTPHRSRECIDADLAAERDSWRDR